MTASNYITLFLFLFSFPFYRQQTLFAQTPPHFHIQGTVTGADTGTAWINYDTLNQKGSDGQQTFVSRVVNGKFELNGSIPQPGRADFYLNGWQYPADIYLEDGNYTVKVFKDSMGTVQVKGPKLSGIYNALKDEESALFASEKSYDSIYTSAKNGKDSALMQKAGASWQQALQQWISALRKSVANEPKNYVVLNMLTGFLYADHSLPAANELYNSLDSEVKNSPAGKLLGRELERAGKLAIGQPFPDFTAPDMDGKEFSTSSLKGHVVLVDFWSSYCGYCRAQSPNFLRAYHNFHAKGLEIVSFSEDTDPNKWKEAIKEDNMIWINVSDLKGFNTKGAIAAFYARFMPTIIIVDRQGLIAAKGLDGQDLYDKLEQLVDAR